MKTEAMKKAYWKAVMAVTAFFCGSSAIFLLSGAGYPGLRILVFVIFFVCIINLSLYAKEIVQGFRKSIKLFGGQSPEQSLPGGPRSSDKPSAKSEAKRPDLDKDKAASDRKPDD